jgi:hypothetical protein
MLGFVMEFFGYSYKVFMLEFQGYRSQLVMLILFKIF